MLCRGVPRERGEGVEVLRREVGGRERWMVGVREREEGEVRGKCEEEEVERGARKERREREPTLNIPTPHITLKPGSV